MPTEPIETASSGKGIPGQAGLKNVEGKAQRRRQYVSTTRSCNAAIGIFSGPRLRPAIHALDYDYPAQCRLPAFSLIKGHASRR